MQTSVPTFRSPMFIHIKPIDLNERCYREIEASELDVNWPPLVHVAASCFFARFLGHSKNTFGEYFLRYKQESDEQNSPDAKGPGT